MVNLMRLTSIIINKIENSAIVTSNGVLPVGIINQQKMTNFATTLNDILLWNQLPRFKQWMSAHADTLEHEYAEHIIPFDQVEYAELYRYPSKIWGIGLNYQDHATDLKETPPTGFPVSFMKSDTTMIKIGDTIKIPKLSQKTTGEAELGIVIGKKCKNVTRENWLDVVAGFVPILDMTAEDILMKNPRYLTLCKNFDTFLSVGPHLITPDEISDLANLTIATVINGKIHAQNQIKNMTFPPEELVSFHSNVMKFLPGDLILTGTPQAVKLNHGDVLECRIDGFPVLKNPVVDLKHA